MQKTKLGISVGLMGFIMYLAVGFGGYIPMLIFAGYILLMESNEWLKRSAIKAALLLVCFSLLNGIVDLIPSTLSILSNIFAIFNSYINLTVVTGLTNIITSVISVVKVVLFIILAIKALTQGTVGIKFVDKMINKHSGNNII